MATTAIDSLRGILNGFRDLNSKGIYPMNATETDLLRQILLEVESLSLGSASDPSQITSETAPTTRADGSALQVGDRWYKPSVGQEGFWNSTLWLSTTEYILGTVTAGNLSASGNGTPQFPTPVISETSIAGQINIFLTRCLIHSNALAINDADNHWSIFLSAQNGFGSGPSLIPSVTVNTIGATSQGGFGMRKNTPINTLTTAVPWNLTGAFTKVGNPSTLLAHVMLFYRIVL